MRHILTILLLVLSWLPAQAGNWWTQVSDIRMSAEARLEANRGSLYLYDRDKAFRSDDRGRNWTDIGNTFKHGVAVLRTFNGMLYAFTATDQAGHYFVYRKIQESTPWEFISQFALKPGEKLHSVEDHRGMIYAVGEYRSVASSRLDAKMWRTVDAPPFVGQLTDFAAVNEVWVMIGTQGAMWSTNEGVSWNKTYAPNEVGNQIVAVEAVNDKIFAAGNIGAVHFDIETRSWYPMNDGLPSYANLLGKAVTLLNRNGVLFGVFKTFDGVSSVVRLDPKSKRWIEMVSVGIPPHIKSSQYSFAVLNESLFAYCHSDDVGFVGVYQGINDAPTSVNENEVQNATFTLSPFPANSDVVVRRDNTEVATIEVVAITGERVLELQSYRAEESIPLYNVSPGMYYLRLTQGSKVSTKPLIVQR